MARADSEPARCVELAPGRLLYGHGEAPGSELVRRTRQAIHQPEHDVELCSIRDGGRSEVDVDRAGPPLRCLQCDERSRPWEWKRHKVWSGWTPRRQACGTLANAV